MKEVAVKAGVSISTVSRVLNDPSLVDEKTRQRVNSVIQELKYTPNFLAKALKKGKFNTIVFMIPNLENPIYPTLAIAVEEQARERGYYVLLCNTKEDLDREAAYIERLCTQGVDGFLFSTALTKDKSKEISRLKKEGMPTVCLVREAPDEKDSFVCASIAGGMMATEYLIEKGYRDIVTLTGRQSLALYKYRTMGYKQALEKFTIPFLETNIWDCTMKDLEKAQEIVTNKVKQGIIPKAIFAQSDPLALDAIIALTNLGMRVPEDIAIIGFDNIHMANNMNLTTIDQPLEKMAIDAVNHLIDIIENKASSGQELCVYPTQLIKRNSA